MNDGGIFFKPLLHHRNQVCLNSEIRRMILSRIHDPHLLVMIIWMILYWREFMVDICIHISSGWYWREFMVDILYRKYYGWNCQEFLLDFYHRTKSMILTRGLCRHFIPLFLIQYLHPCCRLCGAFTMDVIASTSFGIEVDSQKDPNNRFVHFAKEAALGALAGPMMMLISKSTKQ